MGTSYLALSLDAELASWLQESGLALPSPLPASRLPTLHELKTSLAQLESYLTTQRLSPATNSIDFEVVDKRGYEDRPSTTVWAKKQENPARPPAEADTVEFSFPKGSPELAVLIVERLASFCGPLVLIEAANAKPLLVTSGIDPVRTVAAWLGQA